MKENRKSSDAKADPDSWQRFEDAMRHIVSVPHSEIKAHLDAEKAAKRLKRTRKSKYAAFRAVNRNG